MATYTNIHHALSAIRTDHVKGYMVLKGWNLDDSTNPDALFFEKEDAAGEQHRFWIWESPEKPKFHSRIHNLLFALSVFEGREPIEIANDMCQIATESESTEQETIVVHIHNSLDHTLECVSTEQAAVPLWSGSSYELQFEAQPLSIELAAGRIVVATQSSLRIVHAARRRTVETPLTVTETFNEVMRQFEVKMAASARQELQPTLARLDFEIDQSPTADEGGRRAMLRLAATLAAAVARRLPSAAYESTRVVWSVCGELLARVGLGLVITPTAIGDLFAMARDDLETAPSQTLDLLTRESFEISKPLGAP